MRHSGVLRTWHQDRGFGFIAPTQGGRELFVHISAIEGRSDALCEGERVTYEVGPDKDGKPQALKVQREALVSGRHRDRALKVRSKRSANPLALVLGLTVVLGMAAFAYWWLAPGHSATSAQGDAALSAPPVPVPSAPTPALTTATQPSPATAPTPRPLPTPAPAPARTTAQSFRCDGRLHCSQMTSCEEAQYFLTHCPGVKMDGNHDGVPCEQQWCGR